MLKYTIKRVLYCIPVFLFITFIVYALINLAPGGPLALYASTGEMSLNDLEALKIQLGLDKPLVIRYFFWLRDFLSGNMGTSYRTGQLVAEMIAPRIKPTLILNGSGLILGVVVGIPLGIAAAYKRNSFWEYLGTFVTFMGASFPAFFVCLVCVYTFGFKLKLVPLFGMYTPGKAHTFADLIKHLAMPALISAMGPAGSYVKNTTANVLEVLNEEHVKTARAKGLSNTVVIFKHAFRNALIPVVTQLSMAIAGLVGGSVVLEQIFSWPGVGTLLITGINSRDYPVVMGVTVILCSMVLIVNVILDLLYALIDPRIKFD